MEVGLRFFCVVGEAGTVGCAGDDSAGVSGSFAQDEESLGICAFERVVVAAHA